MPAYCERVNPIRIVLIAVGWSLLSVAVRDAVDGGLPSTATDGVGVNIHFTASDEAAMTKQLDMIQAAGCKFIRMGLCPGRGPRR